MTAAITWETNASSDSVRALTKDLAAVPDEVRKGLRPALRSAGQRVINRARASASWSSRIPGAMSLRVRLSGDRPGVMVTVSSAKAPHARPYEGLLGGSTFRHPVFGYRNAWVQQATRPFLWPAAAAEAPAVQRDVRDAIDRALKAHDL